MTATAALPPALPKANAVWDLQIYTASDIVGARLVSEHRVAKCQRLLLDQQVPFIAEFVAELTYPVKVLFLVVPIAMFTMIVGIFLAQRMAGLGIVLALTSNLFDAAVIGATAVFPVCSAATAGGALSFGDVLALIVYYAACGAAFLQIDRAISSRFPLPPTVSAYHVRQWWPVATARAPRLLPLPLAFGALFGWCLLCHTTQLLHESEWLQICLCALAMTQVPSMMETLKGAISQSQKERRSRVTAILRAAFVAWMLHPLLLLYLLFTDLSAAGTESMLAIAVACAIHIGLTGLKSQDVDRFGMGPLRSPGDSQRIHASLLARLRPKQRALLIESSGLLSPNADTY